jgi:hypothetical protein
LMVACGRGLAAAGGTTISGLTGAGVAGAGAAAGTLGIAGFGTEGTARAGGLISPSGFKAPGMLGIFGGPPAEGAPGIPAGIGLGGRFSGGNLTGAPEAAGIGGIGLSVEESLTAWIMFGGLGEASSRKIKRTVRECQSRPLS